MSSPLQVPLSTRLGIAGRGLGKVLGRPQWALTALGVAFLVVTFFVWIPNIELLYMLGKLPALSYAQKISVFFEGFRGLFLNFAQWQALAIILISLLMGMNVALLLAVGVSRRGAYGSSGSLLLAIFGAGCAACGTSILAPLLASAAAATSIGFIETLGAVAQGAAILLLGYSIYKLGLQAASIAKN
jgi:hypothetical protein